MRIPQAGTGCRAMDWQVIEFDLNRSFRVGRGVGLLIGCRIGINHGVSTLCKLEGRDNFRCAHAPGRSNRIAGVR